MGGMDICDTNNAYVVLVDEINNSYLQSPDYGEGFYEKKIDNLWSQVHCTWYM